MSKGSEYRILGMQSNLCTTSTPGTPNLWTLLTGGRCLKVEYVKKQNLDSKMVLVLEWWSLFGGGRYIRHDCIFLPQITRVTCRLQ